MDKKFFRDVSYGMYFVGSSYNNELVGCVINTFNQVNSIDPLVSISLNKDNYTSEIIKRSRKFSVSVISNNTSKDVIGTFGYHSSKDINKYDGVSYELVDGIPVVTEEVCGYVVLEVVNIVDCNSHDIIIAKVIEAKKINELIPMTYKYYHENLKGVSPKKAPTYVEEVKEELSGNKYRCSLCGFIYDDNKEKIKFNDLPDDWKCPLCGAPKSMFNKI